MTGMFLLQVSLLVCALAFTVYGVLNGNGLQIGLAVAASGVLASLIWYYSLGHSPTYLVEVASASMVLTAVLLVAARQLAVRHCPASRRGRSRWDDQ